MADESIMVVCVYATIALMLCTAMHIFEINGNEKLIKYRLPFYEWNVFKI